MNSYLNSINQPDLFRTDAHCFNEGFQTAHILEELQLPVTHVSIVLLSEHRAIGQSESSLTPRSLCRRAFN